MRRILDHFLIIEGWWLVFWRLQLYWKCEYCRNNIPFSRLRQITDSHYHLYFQFLSHFPPVTRIGLDSRFSLTHLRFLNFQWQKSVSNHKQYFSDLSDHTKLQRLISLCFHTALPSMFSPELAKNGGLILSRDQGEKKRKKGRCYGNIQRICKMNTIIIIIPELYHIEFALNFFGLIQRRSIHFSHLPPPSMPSQCLLQNPIILCICFLCFLCSFFLFHIRTRPF